MKQMRVEEARSASTIDFLAKNRHGSEGLSAPRPTKTKLAKKTSRSGILDYVSSLEILAGSRSLISHARKIAKCSLITPEAQYKMMTKAKANELSVELKTVSKKLSSLHRTISSYSDMQLPLPAAADWFLDNFFLVQEHLDDVVLAMPTSYFTDLPMILCKYGSTSRPLPRIYMIAAELLSLSSGSVDTETIGRFIVEIQQIESLTMGELWALPIFLKISLLANIYRATERVAKHIQLIHEADEWCEQIVPKGPNFLDFPDSDSDSGSDSDSEDGHFDPSSDLSKLHTVISGIPTLQSTFLIRVIANLRAARIGPTPLRILDQMLSMEGIDLESLGRQENARVAINNVLMQHTITSLRLMSSLDWKVFFEQHNFTEHMLQNDEIYSRMTFATRDSYRHAVERVASRSKLSEDKVAQIAVELARQVPEELSADHLRHVGYYLVDDGVKQLERVCEYKRPWGECFKPFFSNHTFFFYMMSQFLLTSLFVGVGYLTILPNLYWLPILFILCHDMAMELIHQTVTNFLMAPHMLPRLDFLKRKGQKNDCIPEECKAAVAIPLLFSKPADVYDAVNRLEVQFLANRDKNVSFVLLSDFCDSTEGAERPGDEDILEAIKIAMEQINELYPEKCFFVFHRPRIHNPTQGPRATGTYMGWERKRGKLSQFNQYLLKGDSEETRRPYNLVCGGDVARLSGTRYVVVLDADTVLPMEGVRLLVGTAAHPLNVPVVDERRIVTRGYGVLQPRLGTRLKRNSTRFEWLFSAPPGIDPYTCAVSDVYQDLFGEGSYVGKGIYDVEAFETCLEGRFLENRILSHDLLESSYTRSALVTDIEVYDDFPSKFTAYAKRKHRWVRGDWQMLRWVAGPMLSSHGTAARIGSISWLNRWKLFDNMRRSVVEMTKFLWFALAIAVCDFSQMIGVALFGLAAFFLPWVSNLGWSFIRTPTGPGIVKKNYYILVLANFWKSLRQSFVMFSTLPHESFVTLNAMQIAMARLVTKRNLLEWTPFAQVEAGSSTDPKAVYRTFWLSTLVVIALGAGIGVRVFLEGDWFSMLHFVIMIPVIVLWICGPYIVCDLSSSCVNETGRSIDEPIETPKTSSPVVPKTLPFVQEALRYSLLHWRYFDEFISDRTHWLPPDNVQEIPVQKIAMRTSPTNIAMGLMALVTAADLGFLSRSESISRLGRSLNSLKQMVRHRGHFYNWYSLEAPHGQACLPLHPFYVSTVDSGNLAAALISISSALRGWNGEQPIPTKANHRYFEAISTALKNVLRLCGPVTPSNPGEGLKRVPSLSDPASATPFERSLFSIQSLIVTLEKSSPNVGKIRSLFRMVHEGFGIGVNPKITGEAMYWLNWANLRLEKLSSYLHPPEKVDHLIKACETLVEEMDFSFLVQEDTLLFSIGYNVEQHRLDKASYDLLASEVRTTVYLAVASNSCPVETWFRMGRSLVPKSFALVSWSGTMFEYLMPTIWMHSYDGTLLGRCAKGAVLEQINYAKSLRDDWSGITLPWGVSESAYNRQSAEGDYQYRAFGVPTLALKRGQEKDYVVAPYASLLALNLMPEESMQNLHLLEHIGCLGSYGFRDSVDFSRPHAYSEHAVVQNFMAHHVGMSLAQLANYLGGNVWQQRFHSNPLVASAEILLHERSPLQLTVARVTSATRGGKTQHLIPQIDKSLVSRNYSEINQGGNAITNASTPKPRGVLLGSKAFSTYISAAGGGYSLCDDRYLYRYRNDSTCDNRGQFIYVRTIEQDKKRKFSTTYQPTATSGSSYRAIFTNDSATFERVDGHLQTSTRLTVSTARRAEVRIVKVTNLSTKPIVVELTSYAEVVLQSPAGDRAHPAFGNLFVDTEWLSADNALVARRRSRAAGDPHVYCVHVLGLSPSMSKRAQTQVEYETDRNRFIGRGRDTQSPLAMDWDAYPIGQGSTGSVLDPIFCIRVRFELLPHETESVSFSTALLPRDASRGDALHVAGYFSELNAAEHVFEVATSETIEEMRDMAVSQTNATFYQRLFDEIMFPHRNLRSPDKLAVVRHGQPCLWSLGISGDNPIVLLMLEAEAGLKTISSLLTAHRFWLRKGAVVDLIILNTQPATYQMDLHESIMSTMYTYTDAVFIDRNIGGGVFVRRKDVIPGHVCDALIAYSRVLVYCDQQEKSSIMSVEALDNLVDPSWDSSPDVFVPIAEQAEENLDESIRNRLRSELDWFSLEENTQSTVSTIKSPGLLRPASNKSGQSKSGQGKSGRYHPPLSPYYSPFMSPLQSSGAEEKEKEIFPARSKATSATSDALTLWNGHGGVTKEGFYEIHILNGKLPPAPWCNVIANSSGTGTLISESGGGFTWAWNSGRYRISSWSNDPVCDPISEAIFIRDDNTGKFWSPTPRPAVRSKGRYVVQHQFGKTEFHHERNEIESVLEVGVSPDPGISAKFSVLRLYNRSNRVRRLSVVGYVEFCCGDQREVTQSHIVTSNVNCSSHGVRCVSARRSFDEQLNSKLAFFATTGVPGVDESDPGARTGTVFVDTMTCDRRQFLGRNGSLARPQALEKNAWAEHVGAGYDPCAASRTLVTIEPGQYVDILYILGAVEDAHDNEKVKNLVNKVGHVHVARQHVEKACKDWDRRLNVVQVNTPHEPTNHLLNKWALYQTIACRFWARSAFYQSSGAYGFRDQLQDCLAMVTAEPKMVREHIIKCAERQFVDGDVLHWWHEYPIHGVRTRISDDLAWLPYVVENYVAVTGDESIVKSDRPLSFLEMTKPLPPAHDVYDHPKVVEEKAGLYQHCLRALKAACTKGAHNLPLIGCGDWNDGMNQVGPEGQGESVWLGWFLLTVLQSFAKNICIKVMGDHETADRFIKMAEDYKLALNEHTWDGDWFIRAFYDNGNKLGSAHSGVSEANIDSLAQTWSVISGAADPPERGFRALSSVDKYLVDENIRIVKLLSPPFGSDPKATDNPGYIAGYVPGVRENGAQYTHAATWVVQAHAMLGRGDRAFYLHSMLNPFSHALTEEDAKRYKVEPYVVCADVYSAELHSGRGGWTWYTGSAGWMYTTGVKSLLGLNVRSDGLKVAPCIPATWDKFDMSYNRYQTKRSRGGASKEEEKEEEKDGELVEVCQVYKIEVLNPHAVNSGVTSVKWKRGMEPWADLEVDLSALVIPFVPWDEDDGLMEETISYKIELGHPEE